MRDKSFKKNLLDTYKEDVIEMRSAHFTDKGLLNKKIRELPSKNKIGIDEHDATYQESIEILQRMQMRQVKISDRLEQIELLKEGYYEY